MTTIAHAPRTCDAEDRLKRAEFAFTNMLGAGHFDLGELRKLLAPVECEDHRPAGVERGATSVRTASSPLSLDPHDSYYRPPYTGRD